MSYYVEKLQFEKTASEQTIFSRRQECEELLNQIYKENPSYWPYGLSVDAHDSLYMVREASTGKAVGFTGWQERREGHQKVGYYSIGILPAHRNQGYAKEAVRKLIREKSAQVDCVKAFIMPNNKPSIELAKALEVPIDHKGFAKAANWKKLLPAMLGATGTAAGSDYMMHGGDYEHWSPTRVGMGVLNAALGAGGGHQIVKGFKGGGNPSDLVSGASLIALAPTKDMAVASLPVLGKLPGVLDSVQKDLQKAPPVPGESKGIDPKMLALLLAGGLGAGALGMAGVKAVNRLSANVGQHNEGKVRLRLPTKDPNDQETEVELPLGAVGISRKLFDTINRDTRRKLRQESKERTWKRDPGTKKLLTHSLPHENPNELEEDEEEDLAKAAGVRRLMLRLHLLEKHAAIQFDGKPITPVSFTPQPDPNASPEQQMMDQMKVEQQSQQQWQQTQDDLTSAQDSVQEHASENQKLQVEIERLKAEKDLEKQKFKMMQDNLKSQSSAPGVQIVAPFDTKFWDKKLQKTLGLIKGANTGLDLYFIQKSADWSQEKTLNNFFGDMWRGTKENVGAVGGGIANAGKGAWNFIKQPFEDLGTGAGNFSVDMDNQRAEGRGFMDYDWGRGWNNGGGQMVGGAAGVAATALPWMRGVGMAPRIAGTVGLSAMGDSLSARYGAAPGTSGAGAPASTVPSSTPAPQQPQPGYAAPSANQYAPSNPAQAFQTTGYLYPGQTANVLPQVHSLQNPTLDFLHQGAKNLLPGIWSPQVNYNAFHDGYSAPPPGIADIAARMLAQGQGSYPGYPQMGY